MPNINYHQQKTQSEDNHFEAQLKRVFAAFLCKPSTMLMVSIETGILRANICRYVAELKKRNRIKIVKQDVCPISKHRAGYYKTSMVELFNNKKP